MIQIDFNLDLKTWFIPIGIAWETYENSKVLEFGIFCFYIDIWLYKKE